MAQKWGPLKKGLLHDYGLTVLLGSLFLVSWLAQGIFQWAEESEISKLHGEALTFAGFLPSFLSATFENWQSEFLQLFSFILCTAFLIHRGSPESREGDDAKTAALARIEKRLEKLVPGELEDIEQEELEKLREDVVQARKLHRELLQS